MQQKFLDQTIQDCYVKIYQKNETRDHYYTPVFIENKNCFTI